MKKIILLLGLTIVVASASAQTTSPYFFFKPVYAFNTASELVSETSSNINGQVFTKGVYGSYANGFGLNAGIGKMINSTFGIELGAQYLWGKTISYTDPNSNGGYHVNALTINPVLVIRTSGDLLAIYGKMGLAILTYAKSTFNLNIRGDSTGMPVVVAAEAEESIKAKVGFTAAFGLSFRVSEAISVFGEINGQLMSLPIYKGQYTKLEKNGVDQLNIQPPPAEFPYSATHWVYEKSGYLASGSDDKPGVKLYDPANFSYIGLSVGINFYF